MPDRRLEFANGGFRTPFLFYGFELQHILHRFAGMLLRESAGIKMVFVVALLAWHLMRLFGCFLRLLIENLFFPKQITSPW